KAANPDVLRGSKQLFVACQTDDDLPYVLKYAGEDTLMIGSDYGHADNASELLALKRLKENGDIDPKVIDKILFTNPARFYGLDCGVRGWSFRTLVKYSKREAIFWQRQLSNLKGFRVRGGVYRGLLFPRPGVRVFTAVRRLSIRGVIFLGSEMLAPRRGIS